MKAGYIYKGHFSSHQLETVQSILVSSIFTVLSQIKEVELYRSHIIPFENFTRLFLLCIPYIENLIVSTSQS